MLFGLTFLNSEIIDVTKEQFVAVENGKVYLFEEFRELYHILNLTDLQYKLSEVENDFLTLNQSQMMDVDMDIANVKSNFQQLISYRKTRAINEIGSFYKWIAGIPDREEINKITQVINELIEGNNKQAVINQRLAKQLQNSYQVNSGKEFLIKIKIKYLLTETSNMIQTLNLAKANILNTALLNLDEIEEVIKKEYPISIINVLEYSIFKILRLNDIIITYIKYPIITNKCINYNVEAITNNRQKLILEDRIAKCRNLYQNVRNCKHEFDTTICQKHNKPTCLLNLMLNKKTTCNSTNEKMLDLHIIDDGIILINGKHIVNKKSYDGTFLRTFTNVTEIDGIIYFNQKQKTSEYLKHVLYSELSGVAGEDF